MDIQDLMDNLRFESILTRKFKGLKDGDIESARKDIVASWASRDYFRKAIFAIDDVFPKLQEDWKHIEFTKADIVAATLYVVPLNNPRYQEDSFTTSIIYKPFAKTILRTPAFDEENWDKFVDYIVDIVHRHEDEAEKSRGSIGNTNATHSEGYDYNRANFDALTDGQMGDYDDFDGDIDDVKNYMGH